MIERLKSVYQEVPAFIGLAANGWVLEVFVAPTGTWTAVTSSPEGESCFIASGNAWDRILPQPSGDPT